MVAHERHIMVTQSGQVTISGLPVQAGQRVRVTVSLENEDRDRLADKFRAFFQQVQAIPGIQRLTDEEIANEIALYRRSLGTA